jgi:hypothetical protein
VGTGDGAGWCRSGQPRFVDRSSDSRAPEAARHRAGGQRGIALYPVAGRDRPGDHHPRAVSFERRLRSRRPAPPGRTGGEPVVRQQRLDHVRVAAVGRPGLVPPSRRPALPVAAGRITEDPLGHLVLGTSRRAGGTGYTGGPGSRERLVGRAGRRDETAERAPALSARRPPLTPRGHRTKRGLCRREHGRSWSPGIAPRPVTGSGASAGSQGKALEREVVALPRGSGAEDAPGGRRCGPRTRTIPGPCRRRGGF